MQTHLDCVPCLVRQALAAVRKARPGEEALHREFLVAWMQGLQESDLDGPPPAVARLMYGQLAAFTGVLDPFAEDKARANAAVLAMLPDLRRRIGEASDPLRLALEIAIVGNYMDAGVEQEFDWSGELDRLAGGLDPVALERFEANARKDAKVLILGDNAGEIGLDTLLVEVLRDRGCRVTFAVRGGPILNDATLDDAHAVGMDALCEVVSSGVDAPGTELERCDPSFLDKMRKADLILSKGQGNYESLCDRWPGVFFAFKVKCPVTAAMTGHPVGTSLLAFQDT